MMGRPLTMNDVIREGEKGEKEFLGDWEWSLAMTVAVRLATAAC